MTRQVTVLIAVIGLAVCRSALASPTPGVCRSEEPHASRVLEKVRETVTATVEPYTSFRDAVGYRSGSSSDVRLVTDEMVCQRAEQAYRRAITGSGTLSGRVFVVKAGNTYTIWDPEYLYNPARGGNYIYMVFTDTFQLLSMY